MTEETYNERPRRVDAYTVKSCDVNGESATISTTSSTGFGTSAKYAGALQPGTVFELETVNFSIITGIRVGGEWLYRKSDQLLQSEHDEMVAGFRRRDRELLDAHREEWQRREDALPEWVRARLQSFHESGGEQFELQGWGYELIVAELAVAYVASGGQDDTTVMEISKREGTSGNQHDVAKLLARAHLADVELAGTPSALTPLTGDPHYTNGEN